MVERAIPVQEHEARMRRDTESLAEWELAEQTAIGLAQVLVGRGPRSFEGTLEELAPVLRAYSQEVIGIRMFRTIRAAMAVLAAGYEPEARAHVRILVELMAHREVILNDSTGDEAGRWLSGKSGRGITAKVNAMQPTDLYSRLCQEAHGDPRAVWRLYHAESNMLILGPAHDPLKTRASLLMYAGAAVDQTRAVASFHSEDVEGLNDAVERVKDGWSRLAADSPEAELP